jgi:DNA-binding NarL/FixJ family response regulator
MVEVRVMVVDDQETFRRAAGAVVQATEGFVLVGVAVDGEESLATVIEHRPDLVLMDVNLPGIDGLEATRLITTNDDAPVVVLLSTYDLDELGVEALDCGAHAYVPKGELDSARLRQVWSDASA